MPTAPEITDAAVQHAKNQDCVVTADNNKEWMYVVYENGTTEHGKQTVENDFHNRLAREPHTTEEIKELHNLDTIEDGDHQEYFLVPTGF